MSSIFILSVHISTSGNKEEFDGKWATIYYRENEDRVIQSTGEEFNKYNIRKRTRQVKGRSAASCEHANKIQSVGQSGSE